MKYYIYISDNKVNMLLPQITARTKKKISTEFKFDIKFFSATRKAEEKEPEDKRIEKLETVCSFIREYGNLGTVAEPSEYIEGTLTMATWSPGNKYNLIYFACDEEAHTIGLTGSKHHLIGHEGQEWPKKDNYETGDSAGSGPMGLTSIIQDTKETLDNDIHKMQINLAKINSQGVSWFENNRKPSLRYLKEYIIGDMYNFTRDISGYFYNQPLEFLAKILLHERVEKRTFILATPLYVAMANQFPTSQS